MSYTKRKKSILLRSHAMKIPVLFVQEFILTGVVLAGCDSVAVKNVGCGVMSSA